MHDEELASGGVWHHSTCHGKNTRCMFQVVCETIVGEFAVDAVSRSADTGSFRISALDHETSDDTVEDHTVIKSFVYQRDEIIYCIWGDFRIKLCFDDIAVFHLNCYDWILCHNRLLIIAKNYSKLAFLLSIVSEK